MAAYADDASALQSVGSLAVPSTATLFVGNLAWSTTSEDLTAYCATVGNVVSVEVQSHADTGRSKGWALVTYSTPEEAAYAITQLHRQEFNERLLNVRADRSNVEEMGGTLVFVGNLPWSTTNEQLVELFGQFNPFDVNVKTTMNGRSRGFAIVRFDTPEKANLAIDAMSGFVFEGRTLDVRVDRPLESRRQKRVANDAGGAEVQEPTNTLFVTNLDWKSTDDDLFQHFSQAGSTPTSAAVQKNEANGRSKGWGLVMYNTPEEAESAMIQLNNTDLDSRKIRVRFDKNVTSS